MIVIANVFPKLQIQASLGHTVKSVISEHGFTVNMWKRTKCLRNLHDGDFMMLFNQRYQAFCSTW